MNAPPPQVLEAMRVAMVLAGTAQGVSTPNPPVGAVILAENGDVAGTGQTAAPGGPHAEVVALTAAGGAARGGTAVVTLEPCDHTGRTGPCTQALIAAGVARVVYAVDDPNPVAAGGADTLRRAGVEVTAGVLAADVAADTLAAWLFRAHRGRPRVTAKFASTLDGRIAAPDGTSRWITGPVARERVHRDRGRVDAILIGTGTAITDDPALTARNPDGTLMAHQPRRIVVGCRDVPDHSRVRDGSAETRHVRTHDPHDALRAAGNAVDVVVEGGPTVLGAFFAAGLVDRVQAYLAPTVLGAGPAAVHEVSVDTLTDAHRLRRVSVETLGEDILVTLAAHDGTATFGSV